MGRSGNIEKQKSFIMVVPSEEEVLNDIHSMVARLMRSKEFRFLGFLDNDDYPIARIKYKNNEYEVEFYPENLEGIEFYRVNHKLSKEEFECLKDKKYGLTVGMVFSDNFIESYHLQLKILNTLILSKVAVIDFNSEQILSGKWVELAAGSKVPPSPSYLYSIHAISEENKSVWLHSHGLNRCGMMELEILDADKEHYVGYSNILDTFCKRAISDGSLVDEGDSIFIARLSNNFPVIATWFYWEDCMEDYEEDIIGSRGDRIDSHNKNTGVMYIYFPVREDEEARISHISVIADSVDDNPILMLTDEETSRMRALAQERVLYFKNEIRKENVVGLMKFGFDVNSNFKDEAKCTKEHLWFKVDEISGSKVKGVLIQDAYYIEDLKTDTELKLKIKNMTDWVIYENNMQITPDSIYLL